MIQNIDSLPIKDILDNKIRAYFKTIWLEKLRDGMPDEWVANFNEANDELREKEQLNMLYLLSKFIYFGEIEIRGLLKSLYRDLYRYPIIKSIREQNQNTLDRKIIESKFDDIQKNTRFLGVGNPSESGVHMLYYFRQESGLPKGFFINSSEIFIAKNTKSQATNGEQRSLEFILANENINRYVFIDDFCGSGEQGTTLLQNQVASIKAIKPDVIISYYLLFATEHGMTNLRKIEGLDTVEAVFTFDDTFKAFAKNSRFFNDQYLDREPLISKSNARETAVKYGLRLSKNHPKGYRDCELMLGFHHNTPDNSLPIFWSNCMSWKPIFRRFNKY